jgi:hypothetical protein
MLQDFMGSMGFGPGIYLRRSWGDGELGITNRGSAANYFLCIRILVLCHQRKQQ